MTDIRYVQENIFVNVKRNSGTRFYKKFLINDIAYFLLKGDVILIASCNGDKNYYLRNTLRNIELSMAKYGFYRINRNTVINLKKIDSIDISNHKLFIGEGEFKISNSSWKLLIEMLNIC